MAHKTSQTRSARQQLIQNPEPITAYARQFWELIYWTVTPEELYIGVEFPHCASLKRFFVLRVRNFLKLQEQLRSQPLPYHVQGAEAHQSRPWRPTKGKPQTTARTQLSQEFIRCRTYYSIHKAIRWTNILNNHIGRKNRLEILHTGVKYRLYALSEGFPLFYAHATSIVLQPFPYHVRRYSVSITVLADDKRKATNNPWHSMDSRLPIQSLDRE